MGFRNNWWGRLDLNQGPSGYKPDALTAELRPLGVVTLPFLAGAQLLYFSINIYPGNNIFDAALTDQENNSGFVFLFVDRPQLLAVVAHPHLLA